MTTRRDIPDRHGRATGRSGTVAAITRAAEARDRALIRLRRLTVAATAGGIVLAGIFAALAAATTGSRTHATATGASGQRSHAPAARSSDTGAGAGQLDGAGPDGFYPAQVDPTPAPAATPPSSAPLPSAAPPVAVSGGS